MKRYENGIMYKLNTLSSKDKEDVLTFFNNQKSNTKALHQIILAHIKHYGVGEIDNEMQAKMLEGNVSKKDTLPDVTAIKNNPNPIINSERDRNESIIKSVANVHDAAIPNTRINVDTSKF